MAQALQLRCQSKTGQCTLPGLTVASDIGTLKELIEKATKIPRDRIKVKQGYPPKPLDLSTDTVLLSSIPLRSGDTLIVEELTKQEIQQQNCDQYLQKELLSSSGMLMRKVVPANNSCLFTSVDCVMNNGTVDLTSAGPMRELIAGVVMSDPINYDAAFLGKKNDDYCSWIMKDDSWGGAIEVSILCKYYNTEIDVIDTQSGRINKFGEDMNFPNRVLLIYDGIHYDPLVMEPLIPGEPAQTIFPSSDETVLLQAMDIAEEARQSRQFTDTTQFTLKCLVCNKQLKGQAEAQQHAKATGHVNFGEY